MQRFVRFSAIAAMTWLLSVAVLMIAAHFDVAQAQKGRAAAIACGNELKKQCSGGIGFSLNIQPIIQGPDVLQCLRRNRENLSARCVALAENVARGCERDAERFCKGVVVGQGNILGCLTTSKRVVSARCNAALDAAHLRQ